MTDMPWTLDEVEWGDVVSDKDGVLVVRVRARGRDAICKRFSRTEHRREIANYALLRRRDVPTPTVLGGGDDWIVLADVADDGLRLATEADVADPDVARWIADWYAHLHATAPRDDEALYRETDLITAENLTVVAERWPDTAPGLALVGPRLDDWQAEIAGFGDVLTYNDFWWTNLAVAVWGGRALMFDYNLLGRGYRYADLRNVSCALTDAARPAFWERYEALAGPVHPRERAFDEPLAHLVTAILGARAPEAPGWATESRTWLATIGPDALPA